ncbi:MAG: DEAD/DEAH box helicase [Candidatus Nanopelagicales bacterium]
MTVTETAAGSGRAPRTDPVVADPLRADPVRAALASWDSSALGGCHVAELPARPGVREEWPSWVDPRVRRGYTALGITTPWRHQVTVADLAWRGVDVGLATGTASGKTAAYGMPGLTAALSLPAAGDRRGPGVLYLAPTKALAHDQLAGLAALSIPELRAAACDGDTPTEERAWARMHARWLVTNPDMVHRSIMPDHERWRGFLRNLRFVVLDEAHAYRGVFGAHVALVIRRLLRVAQLHGASPSIIAASATMADPVGTLTSLVGRSVQVISEDASAHGPVRVVFCQPPEVRLPPGATRRDSPVQPARVSAVNHAAAITGHLIAAGVSTLTFARSRRAVETMATLVHRRDPRARLAAYRGGYLPEERRELERRLRQGELSGLAATNALELGIDISGLSAVVMAGWPGSRASFWQQVGRAGRNGETATAMFVARADPLDQYLLEHPQAVVGAPLESGSFDAGNPYVLAGHLCAAAAESPLLPEELAPRFGEQALSIVESLVERGWLRRRSGGWYWTRPERPADLTDLRGSPGGPVRVTESGTGRMLGTVDFNAACGQVHEGAVYTHQEQTFVVDVLDLPNRVALAHWEPVEYDTTARGVSSVGLGAVRAGQWWGDTEVCFGEVEISSQITSFLRRRWPSGEVLGQWPLDLPVQTLPTVAVWWSLGEQTLAAAGLDPADLPGALHAGEHAAIGLLPLVANCDRWDIGGVSAALHPQTCQPIIVVYDGLAGGAGFAERGYRSARAWLQATADLIATCPCAQGCPGCVHSPKCGNGNNPLAKLAAGQLLRSLLAAAPAPKEVPAQPPGELGPAP